MILETPAGSTHFLSRALCSQWDGRFAGGKRDGCFNTHVFFPIGCGVAACLIIKPFLIFFWYLFGGCTWLLLFHVSSMERLGTLQNFLGRFVFFLCWFVPCWQFGLKEKMRSSTDGATVQLIQLPSIPGLPASLSSTVGGVFQKKNSKIEGPFRPSIRSTIGFSQRVSQGWWYYHRRQLRCVSVTHTHTFWGFWEVASPAI